MIFDMHVAVDWSAANVPRLGRDSIWIATAGGGEATCMNLPTRSGAIRFVQDLMAKALADGRSLFVGFDFAFGYPSDANALPAGGSWEAVWAYLHEAVRDEDDNRSNRFDVAEELNDRFDGSGPFWGCPPARATTRLPAGKSDIRYGDPLPSERRHIDSRVARAQPVWKLAYPGSVGSQTLLGIARLEGLRRGPFGGRMAIWPFETRFVEDLTAPLVVSEIYPSLYDVTPNDDEVKDAAQVRVLAEGFARADREGRFDAMLAGPSDPAVRRDALTHEGWMVGFADERVPM